MTWLKRKIVAWLLPEIWAQQAAGLKAQIESTVREHDATLPERLQGALRRYG